eukprot:4268144-Prymnesium_polylepis.3
MYTWNSMYLLAHPERDMGPLQAALYFALCTPHAPIPGARRQPGHSQRDRATCTSAAAAVCARAVLAPPSLQPTRERACDARIMLEHAFDVPRAPPRAAPPRRVCVRTHASPCVCAARAGRLACVLRVGHVQLAEEPLPLRAERHVQGTPVVRLPTTAVEGRRFARLHHHRGGHAAADRRLVQVRAQGASAALFELTIYRHLPLAQLSRLPTQCRLSAVRAAVPRGSMCRQHGCAPRSSRRSHCACSSACSLHVHGMCGDTRDALPFFAARHTSACHAR